jgi:2,4-dienoyl-CoA reductase-like NADH-dependent reductase (Old Yellow Enzyme family)
MMSTAEVEAVREEFVAAAKWAWKIGDDFLHPANQRPDRYGGSLENGTRFFRESIARMREEITDRSFLIGSRIRAPTKRSPVRSARRAPGRSSRTCQNPSLSRKF